MGKNRNKTTNTGSKKKTEDEGTYTSDYTDEPVPRGDFTQEEMDDFNEKMDDWLHYYVTQPDRKLTEKELEYIFSHLSSTENNSDVPDGHLYRVEDGYHFNDGEYNVGDNLKGNGSFRSFSKDINSTNKMFDQEFFMYDDVTIYRTVGNTPYFDVGKHANPYPYQKECFVPLDTMKVEHVSKYSGPDYAEKIYDDYGIDLSAYGSFLDSVNVVDVSYDPTVTSVKTINGESVDTRNINLK